MSGVALDADRLAQLHVFSEAELRKIAREVIDSVAGQLQSIRAALGVEDLAALAEAAHRGRNETLLVGARELCEAFTSLEHAARGGDLAGARRAARAAFGIWPATRSAIREIVESGDQIAAGGTS